MSRHNPERNAARAREFNRRRLGIFVSAGAIAVLAGGLIGGSVWWETHDKALGDPVTRLRADHIISSFENSTTEIQYGYAENIKDGRGITAGRAGFTSGTGDMQLVVERYTKREPGNALEKYLPTLQKITQKEQAQDSTRGLDGLTDTWQQSAADPLFRHAQDEVVDELYFAPAMRQARQADIHSALGELIIYDTIIQQGGGRDEDGLPTIIGETMQKTPRGQVTEDAWLASFLQVRREHILNAADPDTRQAWRESVGRLDALESFLRIGNLSLNPPLTWKVYGDDFQLDN